MDVGCFGDEHFVYIAAFGAFTGVSYSTPQSAKNALGHLAYVLGGLSVMSQIESRHCHVEFDEGQIEGEYIFGAVTNSTSVAGLVRLPKRLVDLGDGKFEVILVKKPVNLQDLNDIILNIIAQEYNSDAVIMLHTSRVRFTFETPVAWTRDGENGGEHRVIDITNKKQAVRVILDNNEQA
jgi:diacylglycerol kinase family enzyme